MSGHYTGAIALVNVRAAKPAKIYYGANTCWWTHRASDLRSTRPATMTIGGRAVKVGPLPCDPRGGMLLETDDVEGFLRAAEKAAEQTPCPYGKHRLLAFMAAHNDNCVVSATDHRNTCFASWDDYNRLLDEADRAGGAS